MVGGSSGWAIELARSGTDEPPGTARSKSTTSDDDATGPDVVFDAPDEMAAAAIPSLKMAIETVIENAPSS